MTESERTPSDERGSLLVLPVFADQVMSRNWPHAMDVDLIGKAERLVSDDLWKGLAGEIEFCHDFGDRGQGHMLLVGLGNITALTDAGLRATAAAAARWLKSRQIGRSIKVEFPEVVFSPEGKDVWRAWIEGMLFAAHSLPRVGVSGRDGDDLQIEFVGSTPALEELETVARAKTDAIALARDLSWLPPNRLTTHNLAERAVALCANPCVKTHIMAPDELREKGFGAILAVAAGSEADAFLVHLRYRPAQAVNADRPVVLVGKAVTFDSGGISLKPALDMDRMKADMAGGAAVIGALHAALALHLPVAIDVLLPVVENMPGTGAMRPGDVITTFSGKTVEVLNTDAEGRLILADALAFARTLHPECVIDLATLTGASAIVFGPYGIGTFVNDANLWQRLSEIDGIAGEKLWRLPLWPEYEQLMQSPIADLANIASTVQKGSMMTAAGFLHQFIAPIPWAHLDIYNSAWSELDHPVYGKGPTGAGVSTLIELLVARSRGWK